jgi:hypothetical protein
LTDSTGVYTFEPVAHDELVREGWRVDYFVFRVT